MFKILQVFYSIFSAFLLSFAIPNEFFHFGSPILGLFSLCPLYIALRNCKSFEESGLLVGLHFMLVQVLSSFWLIFFKDFAVFTLGAPTVAYGIWGYFIGLCMHFAFCGDLVPIPFLTDRSNFCTRRVFLFASVWVLWEWSKSVGFLAYPWGTIAMTSYNWDGIKQIADITGTWGISFLFALFAAVFAETVALFAEKRLNGQFGRIVLFAIMVFASALLYGYFRPLTLPKSPETTVYALITQQNVDPWEGGGTYGIEVSQKQTDLALEKSEIPPDIVLWSESTINYPLPNSLPYYSEHPVDNPLLSYIEKVRKPFLIGGPVAIEDDYYNSANYFNENGQWAGYYAKMQLVPFAEIIPGSQYKIVQIILDKLIGFSSGWSQGRDFTTFDIPLKDLGEHRPAGTVKFSAPICFEDAFPEVCRGLFNNGSRVFINITNDSWSKTKSAEYQHFVIAHFRSIEFRTTLVRSTNSGYSVVVDPRGDVIFDLPIFEECAEVAEVPIYKRISTVYGVFGDWLPMVLLIISWVFIMDKFWYCGTRRSKIFAKKNF